MKQIESDRIVINNSRELIYNFLSNFNNFGKLMPEQIINWQSTENSCSFTIKGLTDLSMKIKEKMPIEQIVIESDGNVPFTFELKWFFKEIENNQTEVQLLFLADLNAMMSMMVSKPLQNFVNILVVKLKELIEAPGFSIN